MTDHANKLRSVPADPADVPAMPTIVDWATFQAELDALRVREKAHTRAGDAIAAARRRLPMVEVNSATSLIGPHGLVTLLEAFEGRRELIAYYFMWYPGRPAAEQCEGCTLYTSQVRELSFLHSRDVTYAIFCQGPYDESVCYRDFMGWDMPWYSTQDSLDALLVGRRVGMFHLVCYLRHGDKVFETYWTNGRGVEAMNNSYALLDMTIYGRQEWWEVGGLARRLAAQGGRQRRSVPSQRTPHRPVVPPGSRTLRRPRGRPQLTVGSGPKVRATRPTPPMALSGPRLSLCWRFSSGQPGRVSRTATTSG